MDAKSKTMFINSVAGGKKIPCPKCNMLNDSDSRFCISCGTPLTEKTEQKLKSMEGLKPMESAAKPAEGLKQVESVEKSVEELKPSASAVVYEEPKSVFAEGLPSWDIVPPQMVVRRKKR